MYSKVIVRKSINKLWSQPLGIFKSFLASNKGPKNFFWQNFLGKVIRLYVYMVGKKGILRPIRLYVYMVVQKSDFEAQNCHS